MNPFKRLFATTPKDKPAEDVSEVEDDDVLAVLEDIDNGREYYLAIVDSFSVNGREYVAMSAYEPDDGTHREPEFVLMRFDTGPQGEHYYQSIRDKRELNRVFDVFFERYLKQL